MKPVPWVWVASVVAGFAAILIINLTGDYSGVAGTFEVIGLSVLAGAIVRWVAWSYRHEQQRLERKK